jgi:hypothetical protein
MPKAPDTPLANNQEPNAKVVAQRMTPLRRAVLRFRGPLLRDAIQAPINSEMNKDTIDQMPTADPTSPALDLGAPEPAMLLAPMAAPMALKTS